MTAAQEATPAGNPAPGRAAAGVTAPAGFRAGGAYAGIRGYGPDPRYDVGLLVSDEPCVAAGLFTTNAVVGNALAWTRERVRGDDRERIRAVVANSGNANTWAGEQGPRDAGRMAELAAARLGLAPSEVLVGSTGVIGRPLPMERIEQGIAAVELGAGPGAATTFARAIMTTDTRPKQAARSVDHAGRRYTVGGAAKGSGMIHPLLATMFAFLTTDAPAAPGWLDATLRAVSADSFEMLDVDMDSSTCDMVIALANGAAGGEPIDDGHPAAPALAAAMAGVATDLTRELARDGEGARTLIEVVVEGARDASEARLAARTIASSPLVKSMVAGRDPNWGRVAMAAGRSGARIDPSRTRIWIAGLPAFEHGVPAPTPEQALRESMERPEVVIRADLGVGSAQATAWGCDLTEEYVRINASYTT
ncbi:MAG: bifunctional glutamate N-acetyltransferase/amino-acid acetyltransferase ArgJ [Chloroflexi bacterium]|nr:bifunctional glutamate N-acetyltransferase/amino-acid acetyltransferase ArgJ [Chloroflexota bacterium]